MNGRVEYGAGSSRAGVFRCLLERTSIHHKFIDRSHIQYPYWPYFLLPCYAYPRKPCFVISLLVIIQSDVGTRDRMALALKAGTPFPAHPGREPVD